MHIVVHSSVVGLTRRASLASASRRRESRCRWREIPGKSSQLSLSSSYKPCTPPSSPFPYRLLYTLIILGVQHQESCLLFPLLVSPKSGLLFFGCPALVICDESKSFVINLYTNILILLHVLEYIYSNARTSSVVGAISSPNQYINAKSASYWP